MRLLLFIAVAALVLGTGRSSYATERSKQEVNKRIVTSFYQKALNEKNFEAAKKYLGDRYVQHNPNAADGREGLEAYIRFLKKNYPNSKSEIKRIFADGDYVILHVHSVRAPGQLGRAIVDIFKVVKGKIVEHWDVVQEIPEKSANSNEMF